MSSGIYKITNIINSKFYIGQSKNIERRFLDHRQKSFNPNDKEYDTEFHRAIREYGFNNFKLEILEICEECELYNREIFWIEHFKARELGYNITTGGIGVRGLKGEDVSTHILSQAEVEDIRRRYGNCEHKHDVYAIYKDKISEYGFRKVWEGTTWKHIMPEIYTPENKRYHRMHAIRGEENKRAILTEKDVVDIRIQKKNGVHRKDAYKEYSSKIAYDSFENIWYNKIWKNIVV